jgi:VCBS repeat-containing protein
MNQKLRNSLFAYLGRISLVVVIVSMLLGPNGVQPAKAAANWVAYNDSASPYPSPQGNITTYSISGTTSGVLKNFSGGANTPVTATFTTSSGSGLQSTTNGGEANSGTDAYTTFNGKVNSAGVIACVGTSTSACSSSDYIDLTFTGLNPSMTYTFATTTVRNGGTSYTERNARYTISDITSATNASTSGVTVISNESVWFNAGNNQTEGYVARWNNIVPGSDGDFTVRAQPQGSNNQFYGQTVFMLQEDGPITGPNIFVSSSMTAFSSQPGVPSAEKSYTVSGINLTSGITITPPTDFELSQTSGSGFSSSPITLSQSSGSIPTTTIYVRFNRATEGTSGGVITHTSAGADTQNLAVSGKAALASAWVAYNDSAAAYPSDASKITEYSIFDTTSGLLKDYETGDDTNVTATFTSQGNLTNSTGNGAEPASGTDAYDTFSGKVNFAGVVACTDQTSPACTDNTWYIDLTFTGLDPAQTYTFATTTVRNGGTDYETRNALFTIMDFDSAENDSTVGVNFISDESIWFNAGTNQVEGYVARWINIEPGADGDFTVRAQPYGDDFRGYGQSVFMLAQEHSGPPVPTIAVTSSMTAFTTVPDVPSAQQSYLVSGNNLTDNIVITPPADFEISTTSGSGFSSSPITLPQSGGMVPITTIYVRFNRSTVGTSSGNITHTSTGATTRDATVSGTATNENIAPNPPVLVQPANSATDVVRPPTLQVNVSDPNPPDSLNVTFYGRALGGGSAGADFRLVVFPDTQHETDGTVSAEAFTDQAQWIADNKSSPTTIAFVTHVGDIVNTATNSSEWVVADSAFDIIDASGVPYSVGPGNHDGSAGGPFETYFGVSRFQGKSWYGGHFGSDNFNNYSLFSAGGMDFIMINLQDYPTQAQLAWANDLMANQYPTRRAIVESHTILEIDNSIYNSAPIDALKGNANLFLILCGHRYSTTDGAAYLAQTATDGHTIHIVMQNYQAMSGGNGYLRIYRFSPANNMIYMTTYSPYTGGSITTSPDQMDLAYNMASSDPFAVIGTAIGVANGADASISWSGLTAGTKYQWYAVVSDGSLSTTGPTWNFTPSAISNQPPAITESDPQTVSMSEDGSPTAFNLTLHASDPDAGNTLTWSIASPAGHGTAGASGTGTSKAINYSPAQDYNGSDSFVVQVTDDYGATDTVTINVNIAAVNDPPVITEGATVAVSMSEDGSPSPFSLTLHATDVDSSTLTWSLNTPNAQHGTAGASGTGLSKAITYNNLAANYNGSDSFGVQVSDGSSGTDTITVNVTILPVNDPPVANAQSVTTNEDTAKAITLTGSDVDNDPLTYAIVSTPPHGALSGTAPNLSYTPSANYNGSDSFTFRVNDGHVNSANATVSITVNPVNDPPVAYAQSVVVAKNILKPITLTGSDVENSPLTYSIVTSPAHGALSGSAPNVNYTPEADYTGMDSFTFKVNDSSLDSTPATVSIEVTEATVPVLPANFYGEVHFSDNAPSAGDLVEAYIDGVVGTAATVVIANTSGTLTYSFSIPGDQAASSTKEGGLEGDLITFKINGSDRVVATAFWHGGTSTQLDLHPPMAVAGGPYTGAVSAAISFSGSAIDYVVDSATYQWDWDNDGNYDTTAQNPSHAWATSGTFTVGLKVTDAQGGVGTATAIVDVMAEHSIALMLGWNLVSFGLHPASTAIADVLSGVSGNYDIVYAWDATGAHSGAGNWLRYAPGVPVGNTLVTLDETQGFWIRMTNADTLEITGTVPTITDINLLTTTSGWNLIGYPSDANLSVPEAFTDHGVPEGEFSLVYGYYADDASVPPKPWKRYAPDVPVGNDLEELAPGWGYWIKVSVENTWQVEH